MKNPIRLSGLIVCLLAGGSAIAQFPAIHTLTYTETVRAVDTVVTINNKPYTISRLPVVEHSTGQRYALTFPRQQPLLTVPGFTPTFIWVEHRDDGWISPPNTTIGGFPAFIGVYDARFANSSSVGAGDNTLATNRAVHAVAVIDIGDSLIFMSDILTFGESPLTDVNVGPTMNLVPFAQWRKFADDPVLLNAADKWIDFVRVQAL